MTLSNCDLITVRVQTFTCAHGPGADVYLYTVPVHRVPVHAVLIYRDRVYRPTIVYDTVCAPRTLEFRVAGEHQMPLRGAQ